MPSMPIMEEDISDLELDPPRDAAMMMCARRVLKELKAFQNNPPPSCTHTGLVDEDMNYWEVTIVGPPNSPYAGGVFILAIRLPPDYPFIAPKVTFKTKIYHPNIDSNGSIRLKYPGGSWSAAITISQILPQIHSLLTSPDVDDPMVPEIAHLYKTDLAKYQFNARRWTQKYAMW